MMTILHLTASPCLGGVERQMLELGCELRDSCRSVYVTFQEEGRCWDFVRSAQDAGFDAYALKHDAPRLLAAYGELLTIARTHKPALLLPHGYKANLVGLLLARRLGIPIISISHGWTGESLRVRLFEALDRRLLRRMDKVVCVSAAQAKKVRKARVAEGKVQVIHDAVRSERFDQIDGAYRDQLELMFPVRPEVIVGAAGRLSPEKGFKHLVDAAAQVLASPLAASQSGAGGEAETSLARHGRGAGDEGLRIGFVLFGDGPLRPALESQIKSLGLNSRFQLAGFHSDLDKFYPHLDLLVLPSYTEGLPNVVLEAFAAGVPVVATAVGGTPEAVQDGINGYLVPPGNATALARRIADMLSSTARRKEMGIQGREYVRRAFCFARQGQAYLQLFAGLLPASGALHRQGQVALAAVAGESDQ